MISRLQAALSLSFSRKSVGKKAKRMTASVTLQAASSDATSHACTSRLQSHERLGRS